MLEHRQGQEKREEQAHWTVANASCMQSKRNIFRYHKRPNFRKVGCLSQCVADH
jgi:hypothetical protein